MIETINPEVITTPAEAYNEVIGLESLLGLLNTAKAQKVPTNQMIQMVQDIIS